MSVLIEKPSPSTIPVRCLDAADLGAALAAAPAATRRWLEAVGFRAAPHTHALVPGADGALAEVWAGIARADDPWLLASLPQALPAGRYRLAHPEGGPALSIEAAVASWQLGAYAFERYKPRARAAAVLVQPASAAARAGAALADAQARVRDLVNTPAEDLGPAELATAARALAKAHGAKFRQVSGEALLEEGFPAVHAVGRASSRAPRLIELRWGRPKDPLLVLVGKGVCFDSGGLDIKSPDGMRLMKKDMGGAANALGLAQLVMAAGLRVRLQLLIPAVDNAIAGNAYRPGDIFRTRSGLHIEIGNTDAEGRVILCDALAYGAEGKPDLLIDLATLTGAARVALGTQLPALFSNRFELAREVMDASLAAGDPLWHMPLWRDYRPLIESNLGDIVNTGPSPQGGAINAALFLDHFVPDSVPWLHVDLFAWNDRARPGRPVGGEAQSIRALLGWLRQRYPAK